MSITLTGKEIKDLAEFAGFEVMELTGMEEEALEAEITISECCKKGILDEECAGPAKHYAHIACMAEYPEEGCYPLGDEINA